VTYLWVKALHIIAIIAWMAGLLYLPRLFVYHAAVEPGSAQSETFKVMERRLLNAIMTPAAVATYVFGFTVATLGSWWTEPWLHAKLALVFLLTVMHVLFARWVGAFARDENARSVRFFRMVNEVPTLLMILIVILVVVKPF
jgi:putative membrane protein